ncbi:MAG: choice-of-anchor V domain-containing protein [Bryobacteraceae bacterium]|nr:choice-of-anchor V domain-containing protein [Bryobacteraceae bacterium]
MVRSTVLVLLAAALLPSGVMGFSAGAPIAFSGVPEDGGRTCTQCHAGNPLNSPGGSLRVEAVNYRPGQKQTIRVTVSHPEAARWGFQLTARRASDGSQKAGTFVIVPEYFLRCAEGNGREATLALPCPANSTEFISHRQPLTRTGANGTKTFEVEWTAPESDIGEVLFYASGNAANDSGNNQGDRIYSNGASPTRISAEVCPTGVTPTVRDIRNAASGGRDVAMNTLISIFGSGFAVPGVRASAVSGARTGYPRDLACVAVEINGERVPLTYVQGDQINAQVPTTVAAGTVSYRVLVNNVPSAQGTLNVVNYAPALFTFNGEMAAAVGNLDGRLIGDADVIPGARGARPGELIQLYATGLGPTEPVWQAGEIPNAAARVRETVTVMIAGTTLAAADVQYAGVTPGQISGLYQINVRVPSSIADGMAPVMISVGGSASAFGTVIPVKR